MRTPTQSKIRRPGPRDGGRSEHILTLLKFREWIYGEAQSPDTTVLIVLRESRVKVVADIEVPEGDDEGVYREEFRRELAKRLLNIMLDRNTEPAREAILEVLQEAGEED